MKFTLHICITGVVPQNQYKYKLNFHVKWRIYLTDTNKKKIQSIIFSVPFRRNKWQHAVTFSNFYVITWQKHKLMDMACPLYVYFVHKPHTPNRFTTLTECRETKVPDYDEILTGTRNQRRLLKIISDNWGWNRSRCEPALLDSLIII
jgi:hypothetical protein